MNNRDKTKIIAIRIESARLMLNRLIEEKNFDLLDPGVIELSQYLDLLLSEYDRIKN